jgi:anti-anti-sigma factor
MGTINSFSATRMDVDGSAVVALVGELDMYSVADLEAVVTEFIEYGSPEVVLDFSGLSFIDSTGLSALISIQNRLSEQGRRLVVRSPRPSAIKVFEITGLMDFLNVSNDE